MKKTIAVGLALLFTVIVAYALCFVWESSVAAGAFACVNCLVIIALSFLITESSNVRKAQIWAITFLYTFLQFGILNVKDGVVETSSYVLIQLVALFLYLLFVAFFSSRKEK